jgi:hypothetical protein
MLLARPRLRPARSKDLKVALGAAPMGKAASLLRDRHFVKGLGHCPPMIIILLWPFDSHVHLEVLPGNRYLLVRFQGPAYRILEKQTIS